GRWRAAKTDVQDRQQHCLCRSHQATEGPLMPVTEIGDPRLQALFGANDPRDTGVRPTVRLPRRGLPPIMIAIAAVLLGILLFSVLNARRTSQAEPAVRPAGTGVVTGWAAPPVLYIPSVVAPVTVPASPLEQESKSQAAA